jgi:hypothetical protein
VQIYYFFSAWQNKKEIITTKGEKTVTIRKRVLHMIIYRRKGYGDTDYQER